MYYTNTVQPFGRIQKLGLGRDRLSWSHISDYSYRSASIGRKPAVLQAGLRSVPRPAFVKTAYADAPAVTVQETVVMPADGDAVLFVELSGDHLMAVDSRD